jgi:uncharacterized protein YyaL (SSP411 family)
MRNELDKETSPYLLQHADNPVHWQPWGTAALQRAKETNKPILLSVGYAACHWCHVMAHESFEDSATAAVMNEYFIAIKVDREERPDIDTIYQSALALLGEQGGWPLTMFLTPDGTPFWGGTYFPPEARYGRPGFSTLLTRVAEVFKSEPAKVADNATAMREALSRMGQASTGDLIPTDIADQVAERLLNEFDSTNGGIGTAPKFPHVPIFELVCRAGLRTDNAAMRDAVIFAMRKISQGGIYDHLRGGYARYSTDAQWLAPHFEKMLYDNAQLLTILLTVFNITNDPLFAERIGETCDWVLAEMIADGGGFAATIDADSEGEEGRFYVWNEAEIDRVLGTDEDAAAFKKIYDVNATGNWEGKCILNRINHPETQDAETETRFASARNKLLDVRAGRVRPGWDDKVLADWNGLMITAMTRAGATFERADWIDAATRAFDFVRSRMQLPGTHRLVHSMRVGQQGGPATLDDYAGMITAALTLYEVAGDDGFLETALDWVRALCEHYADDVNGGFYLTADDASDLIVRTRGAHDGATPSGNGLMAAAFARLFALTGDDTYRTQAEDVIRAFSGEVEKNVFPLATLINANDLLTQAAQVVIIGRRSEAGTKAMITAAHRGVAPNLVLQVIAPEAALPSDHPASGKTQVSDKPTAYVCIGATCSLPYTDSQDLTDALTNA